MQCTDVKPRMQLTKNICPKRPNILLMAPVHAIRIGPSQQDTVQKLLWKRLKNMKKSQVLTWPLQLPSYWIDWASRGHDWKITWRPLSSIRLSFYPSRQKHLWGMYLWHVVLGCWQPILGFKKVARWSRHGLDWLQQVWLTYGAGEFGGLDIFITSHVTLYLTSFCGVAHCPAGRTTAIRECCCHEGVSFETMFYGSNNIQIWMPGSRFNVFSV